jgi:FSR family fosmidomycin resistance protein-like MFS transporter
MTSGVQVEAQPNLRSTARAGFAGLILFSLAHFFIDLYSSGLGSFQPLLVQKFGLSMTQAGMLGGALVFSSSLVQPAYGYLSDRYHSKLFSALAPAVAGIFISCLGMAGGFSSLVVMVLLGGVGIASFHPQASARATLGIEHNRGKWFAVFISAGTLGMALGPTYFSALLGRVGLAQSWLAAIPGVIATVALLFLLPELPAESPHRQNKFAWEPFRAVWKPLTILYFLVFIRSIVQVTYAQFLPLFLTLERGYTYESSTHLLSLYLTAGALGGFVGGHLADRIGGRRVILVSMIGCVPFLVVFFMTGGVTSVLGLVLGGLMLLFTIPVNVVMGQQLAPTQAGTVSALMMGFAWGMAGLIFIPLTGWVADHYSLRTALGLLTVFPVFGFVLAWMLPKEM